MRAWLFAAILVLILFIAPAVQRVSSWGDPICRHEQCPVGYEVW